MGLYNRPYNAQSNNIGSWGSYRTGQSTQINIRNYNFFGGMPTGGCTPRPQGMGFFGGMMNFMGMFSFGKMFADMFRVQQNFYRQQVFQEPSTHTKIFTYWRDPVEDDKEVKAGNLGFHAGSRRGRGQGARGERQHQHGCCGKGNKTLHELLQKDKVNGLWLILHSVAVCVYPSFTEKTSAGFVAAEISLKTNTDYA